MISSLGLKVQLKLNSMTNSISSQLTLTQLGPNQVKISAWPSHQFNCNLSVTYRKVVQKLISWASGTYDHKAWYLKSILSTLIFARQQLKFLANLGHQPKHELLNKLPRHSLNTLKQSATTIFLLQFSLWNTKLWIN